MIWTFVCKLGNLVGYCEMPEARLAGPLASRAFVVSQVFCIKSRAAHVEVKSQTEPPRCILEL